MKAWVNEIGIQDVDAMIAGLRGSACNGPNDWFWTGQFATVNQRRTGRSRSRSSTSRMGIYGVVPFPAPRSRALRQLAGGWSLRCRRATRMSRTRSISYPTSAGPKAC